MCFCIIKKIINNHHYLTKNPLRYSIKQVKYHHPLNYYENFSSTVYALEQRSISFLILTRVTDWGQQLSPNNQTRRSELRMSDVRLERVKVAKIKRFTATETIAGNIGSRRWAGQKHWGTFQLHFQLWTAPQHPLCSALWENIWLIWIFECTQFLAGADWWLQMKILNSSTSELMTVFEKKITSFAVWTTSRCYKLYFFSLKTHHVSELMSFL